MTLQLTRTHTIGKAVQGRITLPFDTPLTYDTLENLDYLIAPGTYPLRLTWSPRFKKLMPEICEVPDRDGLRFHLGTRPEHSQGCVLVDSAALANLIIYINRNKIFNNDEPLYLRIQEA